MMKPFAPFVVPLAGTMVVSDVHKKSKVKVDLDQLQARPLLLVPLAKIGKERGAKREGRATGDIPIANRPEQAVAQVWRHVPSQMDLLCEEVVGMRNAYFTRTGLRASFARQLLQYDGVPQSSLCVSKGEDYGPLACTDDPLIVTPLVTLTIPHHLLHHVDNTLNTSTQQHQQQQQQDDRLLVVNLDLFQREPHIVQYSKDQHAFVAHVPVVCTEDASSCVVVSFAVAENVMEGLQRVFTHKSGMPPRFGHKERNDRPSGSNADRSPQGQHQVASACKCKAFAKGRFHRAQQQAGLERKAHGLGHSTQRQLDTLAYSLFYDAFSKTLLSPTTSVGDDVDDHRISKAENISTIARRIAWSVVQYCHTHKEETVESVNYAVARYISLLCEKVEPHAMGADIDTRALHSLITHDEWLKETQYLLIDECTDASSPTPLAMTSSDLITRLQRIWPPLLSSIYSYSASSCGPVNRKKISAISRRIKNARTLTTIGDGIIPVEELLWQ